jgi:hypothetical protein
MPKFTFDGYKPEIDYNKYTIEVEFMLEGAVIKMNEFISSYNTNGIDHNKTIRDYHYFVERYQYLHGLLAAISYGGSILSIIEKYFPSTKEDYLKCMNVYRKYYLKLAKYGSKLYIDCIPEEKKE